jgi:ABC-type antimicrobial peptide transport system permease subunit
VYVGTAASAVRRAKLGAFCRNSVCEWRWGAQRGQVVGLVLRQAMLLALIGVAIGLAGSFAATPLLADFLYGIKAHDVMTLALVSSILVAVAFLASYIPARHATRIDPMRTLRHE